MFRTNVTSRALLCVVGFVWLGLAQPVLAQESSGESPGICQGCVQGCELGPGGTICDHKGPGGIGFTECRVTESPTGSCFCLMEGELCEVIDDYESMASQVEAFEALERGEMLPADGIFYLATRAGELVLRRKCDGALVNPVTVLASRDTRTVLGG